MKEKRIHKWLALMLAIVMFFSVTPGMTFAAEESPAQESTVVITGSDFQHPNGDASSAATVKGILSRMKTVYETADGFLFDGDYSQGSRPYHTESGLAALKDAVNEVYPGLADRGVYVQGNHDREYYNNGGTGLTEAGAHDEEEYGVYVINLGNYDRYNTSRENVQKTADGLKEYLDQKVTEKYDKPVFVLSHVPLHITKRMEGDNKHADLLFNAVNEAAGKGLNVIYLFGHNHSGYDDYLGAGSICLTKGDHIGIPQNSSSNYKTETLNFTYMNAGYTGDYSGGAEDADTALTMCAFEISENEVKISRYDAEGVHNVKSKGVENSSKGNFTPDTKIYESPLTINLDGSEVPPVVPEEGTYTKVADLNQLTDGGQYLIVYAENSASMRYDLVSASVLAQDKVDDYKIQHVDIGLTSAPETITANCSQDEWTFTGTNPAFELKGQGGILHMEDNDAGFDGVTGELTTITNADTEEHTFYLNNEENYYLCASSHGYFKAYNNGSKAKFYIYKKEDKAAPIEITSVTLSSENGWLYVDDENDAYINDAEIIVAYSDGTVENIPLTLDMISGEYQRNTVGEYSGLTVTYEGTVAENFTLIIKERPEKEYVVSISGEEYARGIYNTKITLEAPETGGQTFAGWAVDGTIVSADPQYSFYIAGNVDFIPIYDTVQQVPKALLSNVITTKRPDGKYDVKFVGQIVLPDDYTIEKAGLVWNSNVDADLVIDNGLKETCITKISDTNQFSVTIKGMPADKFICGKIFATVKNSDMETIYSEMEVADPSHLLK